MRHLGTSPAPAQDSGLRTRMFLGSRVPAPCPGTGYRPVAAGSRARPAAGFTLLELMVVLAIAALLLAITPPLISSVVPGVELKASARRVAAGLRLAREEAIRGGRDVAFTLDVEARTYRVDGNYKEARLAKDLRLKLEAAETEMLGDHRGSVRFFPDGSSTGGRIILSHAGHGYQVGVKWLTGRVEMAPWDGGE